MTLITRQQKGIKLTIEEMDSNLTYLEELAQSGASISEVTYSELVTLIQNEELVPLQYYKITDYQTVHYILDGNNATTDINTGATESLIVKSVSNNQIDKTAISLDYTQDLIYYDWDANNWLDDVSFGNGIDIVSGFKGVIYFRKDTLQNNELSYDFRNVKMRRWLTNDINVPYIGTRTDDPDVIDTLDYRDYYTFSSEDGNQLYDDKIYNNIIEQPSLVNRIITNIVYIKEVNSSFYSNIIKQGYNTTFYGEVYNNNLYLGGYLNLNGSISDRIIKMSIYSKNYNNHIECGFEGYIQLGAQNYSFTGNYIKFNYAKNLTFLASCISNTIKGDWVQDISFNSSLRVNNITILYAENCSLGRNMDNNYINVNYFASNVFSGGRFTQNYIDSDYFANNEVITNSTVSSNTFNGDYFYDNKFNTNFYDNLFDGDYFESNEFTGGNNVYSNKFLTGYMYNNKFQSNGFARNLIGNIFYTSLNSNTITLNSVSQYFSNNVIHSEFNNNNITVGRSFTSNIIGHNFRNNTITISNVSDNEFKSNVIGNLFENNTITDRFVENVIGNFCNNNTFGDVIFSNQIGNSFNNNVIGDWFINNVVDSNVAYITTSGGTEQNDAFRNNHITGLVQGTISVSIGLSQPEYYESHLTTTYRRPDNTIRMKYEDDNDTTVIKSPTV